MRIIALLILLLLASPLARAAGPNAVSLEIERTSVPLNASLRKFDTVYMDIAYRADRPVRLQARAYAHGASVDAGQSMNASQLHPVGLAHALVWVSYSQAASVDEIRVTAYDEEWQPLSVLSAPARLSWTNAVGDRPARPGWVPALVEQDTRLDAAYRAAHPPKPDPLGDVLVQFVFLSAPGYFLAQIAAALMLRGRWRLASLAPLLIIVPAAAHAAFALAADSNLWPIMVIFAAPLGFVYLLCLFAARLIRRRLSPA